MVRVGVEGVGLILDGSGKGGVLRGGSGLFFIYLFI